MPRRARLTDVPGLIALIGSGEFTAAMLDVDRALLAATGRSRPRVAIVPTASWPDGEATFRTWIEQGCAHFGDLGAEVEPVELRDRKDADDPAWEQAIGEADVVYLSGGKPGHLLAALRDTAAGVALGRVHARGGVVAGCSAGAMVLAGHQPRVRGRRFVRLPVGWTVCPRARAGCRRPAALRRLPGAPPRGGRAGGAEGYRRARHRRETAAVGIDGAWQVRGRGRVTVWSGRHRTRYREGEVFRLPGPASAQGRDPGRDEPGPGDDDER